MGATSLLLGYLWYPSHKTPLFFVVFHPQGTCVLLKVNTLNELINYFQGPYQNPNVLFELNGVHIDEKQMWYDRYFWSTVVSCPPRSKSCRCWNWNWAHQSTSPVVSLHLIPRIQYHPGIPVTLLTGSSFFIFLNRKMKKLRNSTQWSMGPQHHDN